MGRPSIDPELMIRMLVVGYVFAIRSERLILFASCTNFRAVEARPLLMQRFGVPVVTSNQATIDAVFEAVGVTTEWPMATCNRGERWHDRFRGRSKTCGGEAARSGFGPEPKYVLAVGMSACGSRPD
jgi:Transposase domain (DUF772)